MRSRRPGRGRVTLALVILVVSMAAGTFSCTPASTAGTAAAPPPTPVTPAALRPTPVPSPVPTAQPTASAGAEPSAGTPVYSYRVLQVYPHDREAFTQGLVYVDGVLYEGTGLWGQSSLRRVDLATGTVLQIHALSPAYFGEGITLWDGTIRQLTWKGKKGFVYNQETFALEGTFTYPTEGWGLTHDGTRLIMSDGSSYLYFRDPDTFEELARVQVYDDQGPVIRLNELEYIEGQVFANVWQTDYIARIDPATGQVTAWINLSGLLAPEDMTPAVDVLNGIAYDADQGRLFVTGKLWPKLFEIELVEPAQVFVPLASRMP